MAITITRTPWIDDDGTGTSGTVINNAVKTDLYNQIDAALAQLLPLAGGNVTGNLNVGGVFAVSGQGTHAFAVSAAGMNIVQIANFGNTGTSGAALQFGNNGSGAMTNLQVFASGFTASGFFIPDSTLFAANGTNGLTISAGSAGGIMRFATAGAERLRIDQTGFAAFNNAQNFINARVGIAYDTSHGLMLHHISTAPGLSYCVFMNAANGTSGSISQPTETSVSYNTTSDARLKTDRGRAVDLSALRGVVVHDFTWKADGRRDRGVFAQETDPVFPRAITPGTDDVNDAGALVSPWMTDYSKFVPDLIAGFQQHDAELAALRAALAITRAGAP
jgi:hypothetical protein